MLESCRTFKYSKTTGVIMRLDKKVGCFFTEAAPLLPMVVPGITAQLRMRGCFWEKIEEMPLSSFLIL